jgi:hypothetical protein
VIAAMFKRWGSAAALLAVAWLSTASAQILIPTVYLDGACAPVASPTALIPSIADYELILPTNSVGQPSIADGVLRYTSSNVAGSEAGKVDRPVGSFTYRYFRIECSAGVNELVMRAPISGSPTTASPPSGSNDHTRVEFRQIEPGPSGHTTGTKGDFLLSEKLQMTGLCRPMRFPDRDNTGSTTADNNLTLMQLQPTDGTPGANTTFVILALRKSGELDATMRNADGSNAADGGPGEAANDILLTGVDLGDVIWWQVTTAATQVTWRAENRTKAPGTIVTKVMPVPDVTGAGVNQRTRYHAHKWGSYHGTNVTQSSDDIAGKRNATTGIVAHEDVTDYAEVRYRSLTYAFGVDP